MLDGIWPGKGDTMAVQRYVRMHFFDDWTTYLYFAQWGNAQLAADLHAIVRLEDWLLVSEEYGGGRSKGEEIQQPPNPLTEIKDGGMIGRTGNACLSNPTPNVNKTTPKIT